MAGFNRKEIIQAAAVKQAYQKHKHCCENWREGKPKKVWRDEDGCLCIQYESGKWWHYRQRDDGNLEWW